MGREEVRLVLDLALERAQSVKFRTGIIVRERRIVCSRRAAGADVGRLLLMYWVTGCGLLFPRRKAFGRHRSSAFQVRSSSF